MCKCICIYIYLDMHVRLNINTQIYVLQGSENCEKMGIAKRQIFFHINKTQHLEKITSAKS